MLAYTETVKKLVEAYGYPEVRAAPYHAWKRKSKNEGGRIQLSYAVSHPAGTRQKGLWAVRNTAGARHSQRKILSKSWEKVTSP